MYSLEHEVCASHYACASGKHVHGMYRIEQNFGSTKFWRNCDFETLAKKTLANPRLACIFIIVRAR